MIKNLLTELNKCENNDYKLSLFISKFLWQLITQSDQATDKLLDLAHAVKEDHDQLKARSTKNSIHRVIAESFQAALVRGKTLKSTDL